MSGDEEGQIQIQMLLPKRLMRAINSKQVMDQADEAKGKKIYVMRENHVDGNGKAVKIGISKNPEKRRSELQTGNKDKLTIEFTEPVSQYSKVEKKVHEELKQNGKHIRGEFFSVTPEKAIKAINENKEEIEKSIYLKPDENGWCSPYSEEVVIE